MALSDLSRESLLPSFLYSASPFTAASRLSASSYQAAPAAAGAPAPPASAFGGGSGKPFSINSPNEKIEMYSPAFYAACTAGGIASCGLTHMAVTPLDLVKCNMQVNL
jgi:solute carrier family 25 phosphate transporter 3